VTARKRLLQQRAEHIHSARSYFSMTTTAIKTLKGCIMTELCLIITGEEDSLETKRAEVSAAASPITLPE
jgi:hypothetical protein